MTPTIYVLGHLDVFQQALVGLQMIFHPTTGSTDWAAGTGLFGAGPIVMLGLLASLLHLSTKGIWTQQLHVHHVPLMLVLYAAFFIPTTTVDVHDILSGTDAIVDNIPIGVAYPAAIISNLGFDAAEQLGQAFQSTSATSPPTDITNGVASPLRQMLAIRRLYAVATSQQPALSQDVADFVAQCIYPNAPSAAAISWPAVYTASSLNSVLLSATTGVTLAGTVQMLPLPSSLVPAGASPCTSGTSTTTYCTETCSSAQTDLQAAMSTWLTSSGGCAQAVQMATADPNMSQVQDCGASINSSLQSVVGASPTAASILTGANNFGVNYVENMYLGCLASQGWQMGLNANAAAENSSLTLPSYCVIDGSAQNSLNVNSAASANLFVNNMAGMMSVLQFLFFALTPLVAAAMVFAGAQGVGLLMKFLLFGMWTQSWMAVAAILNDYAQYTISDTMSQIMSPTAAAGTTTVAASNLTSMAHLGMLVENVQKTLGTADMMLAMTPIITMFVFTGSYMALANVAGRMSGDVKDATAPEAQSVGAQMNVAGVKSTGDPSHPGYFDASSTMDGIHVGTASQLQAGVTGTVSQAAVQAQVAQTQLGLTIANASAARFAHQVGLQGGHNHQVSGSFDQSTGYNHREDVGTNQQTARAWDFVAQSAYNLNLQDLLNRGANRTMTPQQISDKALEMTEKQLENPAALASNFSAAGLGALAGLAKGFGTGLKGADASKVAKSAQRSVDDALTHGTAASLVTQDSGSLGLSAADQAAISDDKRVQDQLQKTKNAQDTYNKTKQLAHQVGESVTATAGQGLNGQQLMTAMLSAGNGNIFTGGMGLLQGTPDLQKEFEAGYQARVRSGLSPTQSAVTAYAAVLAANQKSPQGLEAMDTLYSQKDMIGLSSDLQTVLPTLRKLAANVQSMKQQTALNPQEQATQRDLQNEAPAIRQDGQQAVQDGGKLPISLTPAGAAGSGNAAATGTYQTGAATVNAQGSPTTSQQAYQQKVQGDKDLQGAQNNALHTLLPELSHLEGDHPTGALITLAGANTVGGLINGLAQNVRNRAMIKAAQKGLQSDGKGKAPSDDPPGKGPSDDPPKGSSNSPQDTSGPPENNPAPTSGASGEVTQGPSQPNAAGEPPTSATPSAAQRQAAGRAQARAELGQPDAASTASPEAAVQRQQLARQAVQSAEANGMNEADVAARAELLNKLEAGGAEFVAKTATAQEVAAASAAVPGVGDVVSVAVEGGVLLMNADQAASLIQTGYQLVEAEGGLSAVGKKALEGTINEFRQAYSNKMTRQQFTEAWNNAALNTPLVE